MVLYGHHPKKEMVEPLYELLKSKYSRLPTFTLEQLMTHTPVQDYIREYHDEQKRKRIVAA